MLAHLQSSNEFDQKRLLVELRAIVASQFDMIQRHRNEELKTLEERISRARGKVEERSSNREAIIDRQIQKLLKETGRKQTGK